MGQTPRRVPLSFAQERMWVLEQLASGQPICNMPVAFDLEGALDVPVLRRCLDEIVRRHDVLRATFAAAGGRLAQRIPPAARLDLALVQPGDLPAQAWRPFDLGRGPLLRAALARLGDERHVLLLTAHRIAADARSMRVLAEELAALYAAYAAGKPSPLLAPPVQYAGLAEKERLRLEGGGLEARLAYWKERLGGELPVLELPADRPRPAVQSLCGATRSLALPAALASGLRAMSREEGVEAGTTLLAAFQALLQRYTGLDDIIVGTPVVTGAAGAVVGPLENPLVLRVDLGGDPTFRELLGRTRAAVAEARAGQDVPFSLLAETLAPRRDLGRTPLFQAMYAFGDAPRALQAGDLRLRPVPAHNGTSEFDLTLALTDDGATLAATAEYNVDLFDDATIDRLLGCFATLLAGIVADPRQRLAGLPLLTAEDRRRQLVDWNATAAPYPHDTCVHELFAARAAHSPAAVAATFQGQELTYGDLEWRSNQLARYLRRLGARPGVLVGVCTARSLEMIVGLLGILKAGAAYLPLDPAYPRERLAFMLGDAQVPVLLTQERLLPALPASGARVVCLDAGWADVAGEAGEAVESGVTPEDLAYVIYTSGSTGQPKGTLLAHRGLSSLVTAGAGLYGVAQGSRMLQFASPCFDASVWECFTALAQGATLVLAASEELRDPAALGRLLAQERVTVALLPPPMLAQLPPDAGPALETLVVGGEACPPALAAAWAGRVHLVHAYGPTEATVIATAWPVPPDVDPSRPLPIGRPVPNAQVYILDQHLRPVPVGVPGELCVGGVGVARGYLNRPELTAERFVNDPFSAARGARLYRTGDLARFLPGGDIEFLGRIDHQVKVRGFRIEPGEIEAVLGRHPAVREALVLAREDVPGDKRLCAYIIAAGDEAAGGHVAAGGDLRAFLAERLPEYMIPSAFLVLDAFPLTPGGKVDRRALPAPEANRPGGTGAYVAPRTPVEELLCAAWAEVLGFERVSVADDFFELGGHSLLATQVISRIREALGVDLPLRVAFEARTVAALAAAVESARSAGGRLEAPPIQPVPRDGPLPLSFAQRRLWFLDQYEPDSPLYNLPFAIRLCGALDAGVLRRALSELTRRHEALRTTFVDAGGEPAQVIHEPADLPLPVVDLGGLPAAGREAEAMRLLREEARRPFDLRTGPLLRATLVRLGEKRHLLILNIQHIVFDGWSMGVLFSEFGALYEAYLGGGPSNLPDLPVQYADFAQWQRQWLSGATLDGLLGYWGKKLAALPALELPSDRARPPVQTFGGATTTFRLPPDLAQKLKALGRRHGATLFMTLLAAFKALLGRYSGQDDVAVGSVIANRNLGAIEGLIGFFVNTLVLRTDLSGDPPFSELLGRVRDVTLEAYAHQDLPFDRLVEALQPERDPSRSPLFQVLFVLQNAPAATELPGLTVTWTEVDTGTAKCDLTVQMWDADDGLLGAVEYNTDLYDTATIARLLGHFRVLLEGVAADPARRLSELPLLTAGEQRQLLVDWNDTAVSFPHRACVHELFAEQAATTPGAVAATFAGQELTFGELDRRANQLAHYLRRLGVGRDVPVAICVERSLEMVVGLLGILKAGGAYVPLDPAYPRQRLAFVLDDVKAPVLLTQERLRGELPAGAARVVCLDAGWDAIAGEAAGDPRAGGDPRPGATPASLAYIIHTSGSTGRPKGTLLRHRGLSSLVTAQAGIYGVGPGSRMLQFASLCFDASVWECFLALTRGATLVLAPSEELHDPRALAGVLAAARVTIALLPPSLLSQLPLDAGPALETLVVGGEACPPALAAAWAKRVRLINAYGPTEATVVATTWPVPREVDAARPLPIGRPVPNAQAYILDQTLRPVPIGVPGELCVGGVGLARGYLNQPTLTREKFIRHPFDGRRGARLYKTGDLARRLSDGNIEFLGRIDQQVKIRGFRVEPGEVESLLARHPAVRDVAVIAREDRPGDKRLCAYVVPAPGAATPAAGAATPAEDLRAYLKEQLPEYMVPSAFITLDALPLLPNGKVDRRALPAPDTARLEAGRGYTAPRNAVEETLCGIWAQVLGVERAGIHDGFFDLGGHSLLATQVIARVREAFNVELPLKRLFEMPAVADFGRLVVAAQGSSSAGPAARIRRLYRGGASGAPQAARDRDRLFTDRELESLLGDVLSEREGE
jgi:amino acid adenylation domain-containing protein